MDNKTNKNYNYVTLKRNIKVIHVNGLVLDQNTENQNSFLTR